MTERLNNIFRPRPRTQGCVSGYLKVTVNYSKANLHWRPLNGVVRALRPGLGNSQQGGILGI